MPGYHSFLRNVLLFLLSALVYGACSSDANSTQTQSEKSCDNRRTIFNILWSSLATIFACIWAAIHPNVPGPNLVNKGWFFVSVLRRAELMIVTVFAPEVITIWAFRQYFTARSIHKLCPDKLSLKHGFLVSMGAFEFSDHCPVTRQNLEDNDDLVTRLGKIRKEEINDRSKGDGLSKGVTILQATWFLMQCAARLRLNLPITILETIAVGYAVFTVINYAAWWHKPLGISIPFSAGIASPFINQTQRQRLPRLLPQKLHAKYLLDWIDFRLLSTFFGGDVMEYVAGPSKDEGAPRLWSGHKNDVNLFYVVTSGALFGTIFGAVHCAAWRSHFATLIERDLWRVSSLYIALIPIPIIIMTFTAEKLAVRFGFVESEEKNNAWFSGTYRLLWVLFYLVYIVARGFLLLEPFLAMRSLPPGAFVDIPWTNFVPHI